MTCPTVTFSNLADDGDKANGLNTTMNVYWSLTQLRLHIWLFVPNSAKSERDETVAFVVHFARHLEQQYEWISALSIYVLF